MAKKCPPGKYYCFDDKKCKKIPRGYHIGARGYLARDTKDDDNETKKNGNGNSNGNGNGGNGSGNGNGGSGGNGGGNGSGGVGESIIYEKSNPRIPRKAGQPAKSKKHSDLYTDEDPKGTIHGLGFKDVAKAKASVSKIRNSSRSHAHKIQAAVAMEQRAREMGKTSEAAIYRKYINAMKKKTKRMNEEKMTPAEKRKDTMLKKKYDKSDMKKSMQKQYGKEEGKKVYFATIRKQAMGEMAGLHLPKTGTFIDQANANPTIAVPQGIENYSKIGDSLSTKKKKPTVTKKVTTGVRTAGVKEEYITELSPSTLGSYIKKAKISLRNASADLAGGVTRTGTPFTQLRKIRKRSQGIDRATDKLVDYKSQRKSEMGIVKNETGIKGANVIDARGRFGKKNEEYDKYNVSEEGLRDWFGKSSGTTKSGRKVRGWVQVGGKYDGKPCARQPGQKSTPKCVSSSKRRSMSKSERDSAARRKRAADPNQPQKSGAAKPTNVSTDPKKKMSENYFNEAKDKKGKGSGTKDACYHKVKSRYSVWPSAYASGALVKCRKVGAANWGNKSKNEGFSPMQVAALETAGMIEIKEGQKCWKGYEKKGTKMMFGKRYNNCVKKKATKEEVEYTNEGVEFLKKEKEKKKSSSEYINQNESKTRLVKNGHTYKVVLTWRGKTYMVQMFVPSVSRPTRQEVEKEVQKLYPDAKVMSFLPRDLEPGEPTVMMGEENIIEDDMKGMSVKSGHKRPTKSGAGMTAKGVAAYRRRNPGSKLKTAVTGKVKKGSKDAKRRKSYCARSAGQMKKFPKAAKDPNSRLRQARRRWKC